MVLLLPTSEDYPLVVCRALQEFPQHSAQAAGLQNFIQLFLSMSISACVASCANHLIDAVLAGMTLSCIFVMVQWLWQCKYEPMAALRSQTTEV